jgi:hypothetical protein
LGYTLKSQPITFAEAKRAIWFVDQYITVSLRGKHMATYVPDHGDVMPNVQPPWGRYLATSHLVRPAHRRPAKSPQQGSKTPRHLGPLFRELDPQIRRAIIQGRNPREHDGEERTSWCLDEGAAWLGIRPFPGRDDNIPSWTRTEIFRCRGNYHSTVINRDPVEVLCYAKSPLNVSPQRCFYYRLNV